MDDLISVFKSKVYLKPAVFYERDSQTLLIFAERRSRTAEQPAECLVMKKGVLMKTSSQVTVEWKEQKIVSEARLVGHSPMNPSPVYDRKNKTLFLFFTCVRGSCSEQWQRDPRCNKTRLCYVTSEDLGENWRQATDVTTSLPEHCVTFAVGPGHGLQTEDGRLIVPAFVYTGVGSGRPAPHAVSLFSDDCGESWQFGSELPKQSTACQMAEVCGDEGRFIYCSARDEGGRRVEAVSDDNGNTFVVSADEKLAGAPSGCQGSVVSFPAQNDAAAGTGESKTQTKWLLLSQPTSASRRSDLGVYLNKSPFDGTRWSRVGLIHRGPSGHSDLAYIDDGWFACLFECGEEKESEQVALRFFQFVNFEPAPTDTHKCRNF